MSHGSCRVDVGESPRDTRSKSRRHSDGVAVRGRAGQSGAVISAARNCGCERPSNRGVVNLTAAGQNEVTVVPVLTVNGTVS